MLAKLATVWPTVHPAFVAANVATVCRTDSSAFFPANYSANRSAVVTSECSAYL
jgi:hypothetical protein